jgi:ketopantoate reductase
MRILILGAGKMGSFFTDVLSFQHETAVFDVDPKRLRFVYNTYLIGIKATTEYFHNLFCQLAAAAIYIDVRFFVPFHTIVVSLCGGQLHGAESS